MSATKRLFIYFLIWGLAGVVTGYGVLIYRGDIALPSASPPGSSVRDTSVFGTVPGHAASFSDAVNKAAPAVVSLQVQSLVNVPLEQSKQKVIDQLFGKNSPHLMQKKLLSSSGSGLILDARGYILTNNHVISNAKEITVILNDGRSAVASLVGTDPDTDLAVLKIDLDKLPVVTIADMDDIHTGDVVLAIGYPFRIGQTVTQGIISATGRNRVSQNTYENFLQTDAAINPGNSGGALVNTRGEVVGINSLIYTDTGGFNGIGFAIPIDLASNVLKQITAHGYVIRGWLGVEGTELTPRVLSTIGLDKVQGVLITEVDIDGPGDKAGLKPGDIITRINGKAIASTADVMNMIADGKPGDEFLIDGLRSRQSFSTSAVLGQRPLMSQ